MNPARGIRNTEWKACSRQPGFRNYPVRSENGRSLNWLVRKSRFFLAQQRLYFFPLPQGQSSFRPTLADFADALGFISPFSEPSFAMHVIPVYSLANTNGLGVV
jgi:hypothetical protein